MEQLATLLRRPDNELFFYRTYGGAEVDLVRQQAGRLRAAEVRLTDSPRTTRSMHRVLDDLESSYS